MELLFLWIRKYGSIVEQGFNLSGKLKFEYSAKSNYLLLETNENYIQGFFNDNINNGTSNILNVTAIVGANGAGKSTFLDFIKNNIPHGIGGISSPCIAAIRDDNGNKIIYHHESIIIKYGNFKEHEFILKSYKEKHLHKRIVSNFEIPNLSDVSFIFFSNIFDNKEEQSIGDLKNVSTNYLIKGDKKDLIETNLYDYSISETKAFHQQEVRRQLKFIGQAFNNRMVPFKLPEFLFISPVELKPNYNKYKQYKHLLEHISVEIDHHYHRSMKFLKPNSESLKEEYRMKFYRTLIINFFYEIENNSNIYIYLILNLKIYKGNLFMTESLICLNL